MVTSPPYFNLRDFQAGDGEIGLEDTIGHTSSHWSRWVPSCTVFSNAPAPSGSSSTTAGAAATRANWRTDPTRRARSSRPTGVRRTSPSAGKRQGRIGDFVTRWGGGDKWVDGMPRKNLMGIPERVVLALQEWGWIWRDEIIWSKPNPMRSSAKDRTTRSHEKIYMFSKAGKYYYDIEAISEPRRWYDRRSASSIVFSEGQERSRIGYEGRARRSAAAQARGDTEKDWVHPLSVWEIRNPGYRGPHHATFPLELATKMVLAGCPPDGVVLDPFIGRGTTCIAAQGNNRRSIGVDLNPNYFWLASRKSWVFRSPLACSMSDRTIPNSNIWSCDMTTPHWTNGVATLYHADALRSAAEWSVHCCITSPPDWGLRDYGLSGWEGGDPVCGHTIRNPNTPRQTISGSSKFTIRVCRCSLVNAAVAEPPSRPLASAWSLRWLSG